MLHGRHGTQTGSDSYRYAFQGQEKDDEIKGEGNSYNYTYRMHDPRIGRFFAVDPLAGKYSYNSPYAFSENIIVNAVELEGLETNYVYNVTYDGHGNKTVKLSHTEDNGHVLGNYRVYRYFDGNGKVVKTWTQCIETYDLKKQNYQTSGLHALTKVTEIGEEVTDIEKQAFLVKGMGHTSLDFIGLIPFLGEPADGLNAAWYTAEGDYENAAYSAAATLPFIGWVSTGTKYTLKAVKFVKYTNEFGKCAEWATDFVKKYGAVLEKHGATVTKYEINIGKGGYIGTAKKMLSDMGMHQYVEVTQNGTTMIYDNLHAEGMLKSEYMKAIAGDLGGKMFTGEQLLNGAKVVK